MQRLWIRSTLLSILTMVACLVYAIAPIHAQNEQPSASQVAASGLQLERVGTQEVYFSYHGKALLSFGGLSDFIFYAAPDAFNYKLWADWAADHGMNHLRAYPPLSWKDIEGFAQENGGSPDNLLFPYQETSPGSRQFDLTQFNEAYWRRFREQCEYLQQKGIIIHLLMINGWQLLPEEKNWGGHFFNPANNINAFTDELEGNRLNFYQSVSNQRTALAEAQQAWLVKIIETTADLDNVYYDLVHEIAENYQNWQKAKVWIEAMAQRVRAHFAELQPHRSIILAMDTGGLDRRQREWIFTRPYFDALVYGKAHQVEQARDWRIRYKKPYIPQEMWDDNHDKYGYREPTLRVHMRKYLWKFMMAKCQQMDAYIKPRIEEQLPGFPHNYNPNGWNPFENDAIVLRQTWNRLSDYPNLWFHGVVQAGPGSHQFVLSSSQEGLVYVSSGTGRENINYAAQSLQMKELALQDGTYTAEIINPSQDPDLGQNITPETAQKLVSLSRSFNVNQGRATLQLPAFIDDLAIHIRPAEPVISPDAKYQPRPNRFNRLSISLVAIASFILLTLARFLTSPKNKRA